jgi:hypothetical protein
MPICAMVASMLAGASADFAGGGPHDCPLKHVKSVLTPEELARKYVAP